MPRPGIDLGIPHLQIGSERVGQQQDRCGRVAIEAIGDAATIADGHGLTRDHGRSTASASPCPTPMHSVARPNFPPDRSSWWTSVIASRAPDMRSEEHTSELPSLMRTSYAVFCLTKKNK